MSPGHDSHDSGRWRSPGAERWWECKGQRRRICSRPREAGSHGDRGAGHGWGGGLPGSGGEGARGRQPWEGGPARSRKMAAAATPPCPARAPGASPATLCSRETEAGRGTRERSPWTLRDAAGRGGPGIAGGRGWRRGAQRPQVGTARARPLPEREERTGGSHSCPSPASAHTRQRETEAQSRAGSWWGLLSSALPVTGCPGPSTGGRGRICRSGNEFRLEGVGHRRRMVTGGRGRGGLLAEATAGVEGGGSPRGSTAPPSRPRGGDGERGEAGTRRQG